MRKLARAMALLGALLLALPTAADEAKTLYKQGKEAEIRQNYEAAYDAYRKAWELKPGDLKYRTSMERLRFLAGASHVHRGQLLREGGNLPEALAEFEKAAALDASSFIAQQEIRRTRALLDAQQAAPPTAAPAPPPGSSLSRRIQEAQGPVELAAISDQPITLHLSGDSRMIYESLGKVAGINVLFDPDYTPRRVSIDLNAVTLSQALNIVAMESKTFWRPVTSNTIFIAADTSAKRKELEQSVIKSFYLSNLSAASELQDVVNALRQILEFSRVQQVPSQNMVIVRGTPDQVALAEKLINDMDKARPEVIVEVAVLQVRRDKLRQLGIRPPTSASVQLAGTTSTSTSGTTTTTTTTPGTINLRSLAHLNATDFIATIPAATATLLFTDDNTKIIQNPQIRALDGQKASLKIGDKVPVATGSFQPGIGGVGINPLVNTQFQYLDVGVNIDITPRVHAGREVTLKLMIDISSVTSRVNIGGIDQPVIGQRKIEHEIRLKEGEVNLLGGILEEQDIKTLGGIPGLGRIPFFRYFFSDEKKERIESEIVFALIPHIVRSQELSELNTRTLDVGTGTAIDLRRAGNAEAPRPTAAAPSGAALVTQPPATVMGPNPVPPRPAPIGPRALRFDPVESTQAVGSTFVVNIVYSGADPIYAVPVQVSYDPRVLQLLNISNGGFLAGDGQSVALVHREDPPGTLQVSATRPPGAGGVAGEGPVFSLTFVAKAPGQSSLIITRPGARDANMQMLQVVATPATVTVR
ncbi:MAG TPA: secretin N-terminal domain-containing protein [Terriglobales bacterium]|nr:secretin N-terminal domain-containing protein [Terriglobales bacterium]